jgi:16S rRNA (guanine527-N7)-methyltransferase
MVLSPLGSGFRPRIERVLRTLAGDNSPEGATEALCGWLDGVAEWNARVDLTAARTADELVDLMVADAAALVPVARELRLESWVDVGTGAGAPGLPLALLAPELRMTLVEPKAKRVAFLRTVLGRVGRADVRVVRGRSDELGAASHDVAISRATLPPPEWLVEGARVARSAVGVFLARAEAPTLAGFRVAFDVAYTLPLTGKERRLVVFVAEQVRVL